jgi:hypothetical protein
MLRGFDEVHSGEFIAPEKGSQRLEINPRPSMNLAVKFKDQPSLFLSYDDSIAKWKEDLPLARCKQSLDENHIQL